MIKRKSFRIVQYPVDFTPVAMEAMAQLCNILHMGLSDQELYNTW